MESATGTNINNEQIITEGFATVKTHGSVFYNPVQEFNRDLSISVLKVFARDYNPQIEQKENKTKLTVTDEDNISIKVDKDKCDLTNAVQIGEVDQNGITILEALSATGLRSIRYAKEIPGIKQIIANDISKKAVESIENNIQSNNVQNIVKTSHSDAVMYMYSHRKHNEFDVIDLDPYGCPSIFLDAAVQAVKNKGLLLVTATDMAVLAGNCPETCYTKYGAISLRIRSCHEMALRILLQCIESHANRYGRYIEPLLSISADFYIRVFVRVYNGAAKCKFTTSKLSMVYNCTGCETFTLQPLGILKTSENKKNTKFCIPTGPAVNTNCEQCNHRHHMGGPVWSGPLHSKEFVNKVLQEAPEHLGTLRRIQGVLNVVSEELDDVPLYYTLEKITSVIHSETPPMMIFRSAILNGGYKVSFTHAHKTSVKTNAPPTFIWDVMRTWEKEHPVKRDRLAETSSGLAILNKSITHEIDFTMHPNANPESRRKGFVRFQANPTAHWGPGTRATAMVGERKIPKSIRNQGKHKKPENKRKRKESGDSLPDQKKIESNVC